MQPADNGFTHIVMMDTPYYARSPAQAKLPDGMLRTGTKVRILEQVDSRILVETEDGIRGYVAADALACDATLRT